MVSIVNTKNLSITNVIKDDGSRWRPFTVSLIVALPFFTYSIILSTLSSADPTGYFPTEVVPWTGTAFLVAAAAAAPLICWLSDRYGRKLGYFLICFLQIGTCIPQFLSPKVHNINILMIYSLVGLYTGGLFTVIPIYIRDINPLKSEGFNLCLMMILTAAGQWMLMVGEVKQYVAAAMSVLQLLIGMLLLETPPWMVMVGRDEAAKANLASLRGLPIDSSSVITKLEEIQNDSYRAKSNGRLTVFAIFRNIIWRDTAKIGVVLLTCMTLSGSSVFLQPTASVDHQQEIIMAAFTVGNLITIIFVQFVEKKYLLTFSFVLMCLSEGVLAVFHQEDLTLREALWLPSISMACCVAGYGMGWLLPIIVMTEMLTSEVRATILGLLYFYWQVIKLCHVHSYHHIEGYIGRYTALYIFSGINLFGAVYALFRIPDLKGKSIKQMEKQLKRIPLIEFKHSFKPTTA